MNIAIIGYGRMGHEVENAALSRDHRIGLTIDLENTGDITPEKMADIDVAIEFSSPDTAAELIMQCLRNHTPVVSGTTGWLERRDEVTSLVDELGTGFFYASNFSIGVNLLFEINRRLAELAAPYPDYKVSVQEIHHVHKLDAPSGTAISLAEQIIDKNERYDKWQLDREAPGIIPVFATREGEVKGIHHVKWESDVDRITLSHEARSRRAFASGAVMAAEFLLGKKGVYSMKDLLNI